MYLSAGFAFCDIDTEEGAYAAIEALNGSQQLGDPALLVALAYENRRPLSLSSYQAQSPINPATFGLPYIPIASGGKLVPPPPPPSMTPTAAPSTTLTNARRGLGTPSPIMHEATYPHSSNSWSHGAMLSALGCPSVSTTLYVRPLLDEVDELTLWQTFSVSVCCASFRESFCNKGRYMLCPIK